MAFTLLALAALGYAIAKFGAAVNAKAGSVGELRVRRALDTLGDQYLIAENVIVPGSNRGDVDFVLAGPFGVAAIEVKNYSTRVKALCDTWYSNGAPMKKSPSRQAKGGAASVQSWLKEHGFRGRVVPILVFNDNADLTLIDQKLAVLRLRDLVPVILSLPADRSGIDFLTQALKSLPNSGADKPNTDRA